MRGLRVLVCLLAVTIALPAQTANLTLNWGGTLACPDPSPDINVILVNFTGTNQAISSGGTISVTFSAAVRQVLNYVNATSVSSSGNVANFTFANGISVMPDRALFLPVRLDLGGLPDRTPITAVVTASPAGALTFPGGAMNRGNTTLVGIVDRKSCAAQRRPAFGADDLNASCPTAGEVAFFNSDFSISFESDPSAGQLVCQASTGPAGLTRLQERAYSALRLMRAIPFDTPLPWTSLPLYEWFKSVVRGIRFRGGLSTSFCCDPPGVINLRADLAVLHLPGPDVLASLVGLYIHEARHSEGYPHSCGTGDQSLPELGAWGVQLHFFEWAALRTGTYFIPKSTTVPPAEYRLSLWSGAIGGLNGNFCDLGPGLAVSPPALDFGTAARAERTLAITATRVPQPVPELRISGPHASDFRFMGDCAGAIAPPACAVVIAFTAGGSGLRQATLHAGNQEVPLTAGATPPFQILPAAISLTAEAYTGTVTVYPRQGGVWTASSDSAWLRITSGATGAGASLVAYSATANTAAMPRTGSITLSGTGGPATFGVAQAGATPCPFTVSPRHITIPPAGGQGTAVVTAPAGCAWTTSAVPAWITVVGGSGTGSGTVTFRANANALDVARGGEVTVAGQTIGITQSGVQSPAGLRFVPLPPCRVMETRAVYNFEGRSGAFGPPALRPGEVRTLVPPSSNVCAVPAAAQAYVLNVTVIPVASLQSVTLWPAGEQAPNVWTIRSPDGQVVANSAILKAGVNGGIQLQATDGADVLIDISGYYTSGEGLAYYPLTPCRVIDTRIVYRSPPGPFGPPSMAAGQRRTFNVPLTPYCAVPRAQAYSVTLTVVPPGPLPYITLWPSGGSQPNVSSINSFAGRVLANSVIVPANATGSIDVFAFDNTDLLVDVNGYYAPDDGSRGLFYYPVTQCRANDSRISGGAYASESERTIDLPGASGCPDIPTTAKAYAINVTVLPGGNPMPFLTAYPAGQPRPEASILNAFQGQVVTNAAIVPAGANGSINVFAYRGTDVVVEVGGYFNR